MYRVFLSYNTSADEMVVVWRLQTLAAASGVHLEVPDRIQRGDWNIISQMIFQADAVIALLTKRATKQVHDELTYALDLGKRVIPIVERGALTAPIKTLLERSGTQVFELDPQKPWEMEANLAKFLQSEQVNKNARNTILALAGAVVGLLLLQELAKS